VIATSKDELARRALKVLNEGAQAIVKNSQGSLVGAIERHIENAQQNMMTQRNELNQYLDTMATGTVERVQRNLETSRTKATERFRIAAARAGCACDGRSESGPSETGGISDRFQGRIAGNLQASHGPTGK